MPNNSARGVWFLRLGLGILIIAFLLWWQGGPILRAFSAAPWWTVLAAVVFYWVLQLLCAWKWQLLINAALMEQNSPVRLSVPDCARFYLAGMFWNLWMPSSIGGDAVRAYLAGKRCGRLSLAASAVFVDRLSGLFALLLIGTVAVLFERFNGIHEEGSALIKSQHLLWIAALMLLILFALWICTRIWAGRFVASEKKLIATVARKMESLHQGLHLYTRSGTRRVLYTALGLSLVFQAGVILLNIGLALAVQLPLSFFTYWWLVPALALAALLPVGIGGLGVREAAAVAMVGTLTIASGGHLANLIAWSLLWQATLWLAGLPGAWSTRFRQP